MKSQDSPSGKGFGGRRSAFDFEDVDFDKETGGGMSPSHGKSMSSGKPTFGSAMAQAREADSDEERSEVAGRLLRQAGLQPIPGLLEEGTHPASTDDFVAAAKDDWVMMYYALLRHASLCRRKDGLQSLRLSMTASKPGDSSSAGSTSEIVPVEVEEALDRLAAEQFLTALTKTRKGTIKQLFEVVDVDGDGYIEVKEFRLLVSAIGLGLKQQQIERVMRSLDKNLDGKVSFAEFAGAFRER